jgi:hypothetical protein
MSERKDGYYWVREEKDALELEVWHWANGRWFAPANELPCEPFEVIGERLTPPVKEADDLYGLVSIPKLISILVRRVRADGVGWEAKGDGFLIRIREPRIRKAAPKKRAAP